MLTIQNIENIVIKKCAYKGSLIQVKIIKSLKVLILLYNQGGDILKRSQLLIISIQQLIIILNTASLLETARIKDGATLSIKLEALRPLFNPKKAQGLPLYQGQMDYYIYLKKLDNRLILDLLQGLLYSILRDQLLEL